MKNKKFIFYAIDLIMKGVQDIFNFRNEWLQLNQLNYVFLLLTCILEAKLFLIAIILFHLDMNIGMSKNIQIWSISLMARTLDDKLWKIKKEVKHFLKDVPNYFFIFCSKFKNKSHFTISILRTLFILTFQVANFVMSN